MAIRGPNVREAQLGGKMLKLPKRWVVVCSILVSMATAFNVVAAEAACPKVGFTVVEPYATPQTRSLKVSGRPTVFVHRQWITTTRDIAEIKVTHPHDGDDDDANIQIKFIPAADQRLHDTTTNHSGMRFAFLFNDEVLNNVVWQGPYGTYLGGIQVSVPHGMKQARKLMKAIAGCTAAGNRTP
jgi:preprotein translocase subunit SecD